MDPQTTEVTKKSKAIDNIVDLEREWKESTVDGRKELFITRRLMAMLDAKCPNSITWNKPGIRLWIDGTKPEIDSDQLHYEDGYEDSIAAMPKKPELKRRKA